MEHLKRTIILTKRLSNTKGNEDCKYTKYENVCYESSQSCLQISFGPFSHTKTSTIYSVQSWLSLGSKASSGSLVCCTKGALRLADLDVWFGSPHISTIT